MRDSGSFWALRDIFKLVLHYERDYREESPGNERRRDHLFVLGISGLGAENSVWAQWGKIETSLVEA